MSKTIKVEDQVYYQLDQLRGKRETFTDIVAKLLTTKEAADTLAGIWHGPGLIEEFKHGPERIRDLQVR